MNLTTTTTTTRTIYTSEEQNPKLPDRKIDESSKLPIRIHNYCTNMLHILNRFVSEGSLIDLLDGSKSLEEYCKVRELVTYFTQNYPDLFETSDFSGNTYFKKNIFAKLDKQALNSNQDILNLFALKDGRLTRLEGIHLENLNGLDLNSCDLLETTLLFGLKNTNFTNANLAGSAILGNHDNTNFTNANLTNPKIIKVFGDVGIGKTYFNNANLTNATVEVFRTDNNIYFTNANLAYAKVEVFGTDNNIYFNNANLAYAKVEAFGTDNNNNIYFNNANLAYATLTGGEFALKNFTGALLLGTKTANINITTLDPIINKQNETFKYMADIYALLQKAKVSADSILNQNKYPKEIMNMTVETLKNLCITVMRSSIQVYLLSIR